MGDRKKGETKPSSADSKKRKSEHNVKNEKSRSEKSTSSNNTKASPSRASNKKRALMHERQSQRRFYEEVSRAVELWNELRTAKKADQRTARLVKEIMKLFEGKIREVVLKHDASRVVQCLLQFGTEEQRLVICRELSSTDPGLIELCRSQYAHFVVLKLIKYCRDAESRKILLKSVRGHACELVCHSIGSRVLEQILTVLNPSATLALRRELYGPKFTLEPPTVCTLADASAEAAKAARIHLRDLVDKCIQKNLVGSATFQKMLWEVLSSSSKESAKEDAALVASLVDQAVHIATTRSGSLAMAHCASYGTPKDRRRLFKGLKGYVSQCLLHRDAYLLIIVLLDVTDDTVAIQKNILAELLPTSEGKDGGIIRSDDGAVSSIEDQSRLLEIATSRTGAKLLYRLLAPSETGLLDPYELEALRPVVDASGVPTSKKDPMARREELTVFLRRHLQVLGTTYARELLASPHGMKVWRVLFGAFPSREMADRLVEVCEAEDESVNVNESENKEDDHGRKQTQPLSIFEKFDSSLMIRKLISKESEHKETNSSGSSTSTTPRYFFTEALYSKYSGRLMEKIGFCNRGALVVLALAQAPSVSNAVMKELRPHGETISLRNEQGFQALAELIKGAKSD